MNITETVGVWGGSCILIGIGSFFIASHTVALLPSLRVTIAKKLTDNDVISRL